jgi:uncharacterized protein (DUF302 family)
MKQTDMLRLGARPTVTTLVMAKHSISVRPAWLVMTAGALALLSGCERAAEQKGNELNASDQEVTVHQSEHQDVDEACDALKVAIERQGLQCIAVRNLNASMKKHNVHLDRQVRVVEFCKADYARDMLEDNPEVSALMPCTFGVYEGNDGQVYISSLNQHLMGNLPGEAIVRVMRKRVAKDQADILAVAK